jgi:23S rRNA (cytosine1962-C5)-methyltransferase
LKNHSLSAPEKSGGRLRLRITAAAETAIRGGHPWLFAGSVLDQTRAGQPGELAVLYDRKDRFLAIGLFDPDSPLRVRILHAGKPSTLDTDWWRRRLSETLARREGLFDDATNGYRLINGESDGWPALVLDRYAGTLSLKLYSAAWLRWLDEITPLILADLRPERLVLRLSRNIQERAGSAFNRRDGDLLFGPAPEGPVHFLEDGLTFEADVLRGQKTGFFLDQRDNRRAVAALAAGKEMLNAFSFSGGFSLHAARGGAKSAVDLDISAHALDGARRHFALNRANPAIAACRHETIQADAFDWIEANRLRKFDLVVIDPPSLARRESERAGAIRAYARLATGGVAALRPGGILVAASCSAHVSAEEFFGVVRQAAVDSRRIFHELQVTGHPPDHPAGFPEAHYLKCIRLRF